jgi:SLT domain-containing protein
VAGWFATAAQLTGVPSTWIPGLETIGHYESGDNPNAINNWDSNALAGTPSEGIMQVIGPTFDAYHQAGTAMNLLDPVANISAAINYIKARYGDINNVPGLRALAAGRSYVGYDSGGWLMPSGMPVNGLGRPEAVLTPDESQAFVAIVRQLTGQGSSGQGLGSKGVVINFNGTQYPTAEQMAAIKREMALALG